MQSIVNFLRDPTGDIPWDEDVTATDVVHLENKQVICLVYKKILRDLISN